MTTARRLAGLVNSVLPGSWRLTRGGPPASEPSAAPRFYAWLTPEVALTRLHDGHFIFVDPADEQITPHLVARGYWESWIEAVIRRLIRPGDRVIEVGANLGYYTLLLAAGIGPTGRLDSFEANPRLAALVGRSVEFNGYAPFAAVHAQAVSNQPGTLRFAASRTQSGGGHLALPGHAYGSETAVIEVPAVRLDDIVREGRVDFIRMDAEGAEPLILEGAAGLLARCPDIRICTEWAVGMMAANVEVPAFIARLRAQGFRSWRIEPDSTLTELGDAQLLALELCDVILARSHPGIKSVALG
jgi:FkbM family methyltransferase